MRLYALTLLLAAFLLFWVQLLFARMILPRLGGSPAVWTTCLLFFQATLMVGYGYVHLAGRWVGTRRHTVLHLAVLLLPWMVLPIAVPPGSEPPADGLMTLWLIGLLTTSVGLPFLFVSTSAPLLQRWYAQRDSDPYFLYAASNLGSLIALAAYPLLLEPALPLNAQARLWSIGYAMLLILTLCCAVPTWKRSVAPPAKQSPSGIRPWQWMLLSLVPASLLHGTTTVITSDIASVPLLWCLPLALYLLSFVAAFSRRGTRLPYMLLERLLPPWIAGMIVTQHLGLLHPTWLLISVHLVGFGMIACVLHRRLALQRPDAEQLTSYFFWISLGGLAGGALNALLAPMIFQTVLEYPMMLLLAGLLLSQTEDRAARVVQLVSIGLLGGILLIGFRPRFLAPNLPGYGLMLVLVAVVGRRFDFGKLSLLTSLSLMLLVGQFHPGQMAHLTHRERSFFGVHRILSDSENGLIKLLHGATLHGQQSTHPVRRRTPLSYYHPTGPAGAAIRELDLSRVAVLGLGIGSLAAYGQPGQHWDFYELDPVVTRLAQDTTLFHYLADARAPYRILAGDARLSLSRTPPGTYDLIVIDTFNSDAVPVHLATREAFRLYLSRLTPIGVLLINISSRFLDLEPLLGALADDLKLSARSWREARISDAARRAGKSPSHWIVLAREEVDLGHLRHWSKVRRSGMRAWTDDYADILSVLRLWK